MQPPHTPPPLRTYAAPPPHTHRHLYLHGNSVVTSAAAATTAGMRQTCGSPPRGSHMPHHARYLLYLLLVSRCCSGCCQGLLSPSSTITCCEHLSPAENVWCQHNASLLPRYMQETTCKHAMATPKQPARKGFTASSCVLLTGLAPGAVHCTPSGALGIQTVMSRPTNPI